MKQMTKNEYKEFTKECANKLYTQSGYGMDDFKRDTEEVEILPLDLSKFPQLKEDTIKWINSLFDEEDTDRNENYMLRGFTHHERAEVDKLGCNYGDFADCYSFFAYNKEQYLIYTYCEGDTTLTILPDKETYDKEYAETYAWYKEARG